MCCSRFSAVVAQLMSRRRTASAVLSCTLLGSACKPPAAVPRDESASSPAASAEVTVRISPPAARPTAPPTAPPTSSPTAPTSSVSTDGKLEITEEGGRVGDVAIPAHVLERDLGSEWKRSARQPVRVISRGGTVLEVQLCYGCGKPGEAMKCPFTQRVKDDCEGICDSNRDSCLHASKTHAASETCMGQYGNCFASCQLMGEPHCH